MSVNIIAEAMGLPRLSEELYPQLEGFKGVLLVGPTDVGKSHFVRGFARYLLFRGRVPVVVDLDVGQSDVGPVGTLGAVRVDRDFALLEELSPFAVSFFGFCAPSRDVASYVWALSELAGSVERRGPVVVDTTGWVSGYEAFSLKVMKASLFGVEAVVLVGERVHPWSRFFSRLGLKVFPCLPSSLVVPKDRARRRINRYASTCRFFEGAPLVRFRVGDYAVWSREMSGMKGRIFGAFDGELFLVGLGWVCQEEDGAVVARYRALRRTGVKVLRFGEVITL